MSDYNLSEDEFVLLQEERPLLGHGKDDDPESLDEVVLTNENLILVNTINMGVFKTKRMLMRCPLEQIICANGRPQMAIMQINGLPYLRIPFADGAIQLRFSNGSRHHAQSWADNIAHAAAGEFDQIQEDSGIVSSVMTVPGAESAAELVGNVFAGIRSAVQTKAPSAPAAPPAPSAPAAPPAPSAPAAPPAPAPRIHTVPGTSVTPGSRVAPRATAAPSMPAAHGPARCVGCHAPLEGKPGKRVVCPYCGTTQTI